MELRLRADILAPQHVKVIKVSGHNPSKALKSIPSLIKQIFRLGPADFFEDRIKWDTSGETIGFFAQWRGRVKKDARTNIWVKVRIQGKESPKDKKGELTVWITGELVTTLPYRSILEKAIARSYSFFFYSEHRRRYVVEAKRLFDILESEIKKLLEIEMGG
jgi:hypothetical protein